MNSAIRRWAIIWGLCLVWGLCPGLSACGSEDADDPESEETGADGDTDGDTDSDTYTDTDTDTDGDADGDGGDDSDDDTDQTGDVPVFEEREVELNGSVQKGPFVIGSTVAVSLLDAELDPTGQVFNTQTINDKGEFEVTFSTTSAVALQGGRLLL